MGRLYRLERRRRQRNQSQLRVERAEPRVLLAGMIYTVTNTADSGMGSLRQAILDANGNTGADTIEFAIAGQGVQTIQPLSSLPSIDDPVLIDGTTQPGYAPGSPLVEIDGSQAGSFVPGLIIAAPDTTVQGLVINRFGGSGIEIDSDGALIQGNFIGTDPTGMLDRGNAFDGITVFGTAATIGGTTSGSRNLISGNGANGIGLENSFNTVLGNLIGTSFGSITALPGSFQPIPNDNDGVFLDSQVTDCVIGAPGAGNLIAANRVNGIELSFATDNNLIQGNGIGTTLALNGGISLGPGLLANGQNGILSTLASNNTIGGTVSGAANVISNNNLFGIQLNGNDPFQFTSPGNVIAGNLIGMNAAGIAAQPNGLGGIAIGNSRSNTIGGTTVGSGNTIAGNNGSGVTLNGAQASGNVFLLNQIGTDPSGTRSEPNSGDGISMINSGGNTIGMPLLGNRIAANKGNGIFIQGTSASGNSISGNVIGLASNGTMLPNTGDGLHINAPSNVVGGMGAGEGNVISANLGNGIHILAQEIDFPAFDSSNNVIQGNRIGTTEGGALGGVGNQQDGILVEDSAGTTIGGSTAAAGNIIAGNRQSGVHLFGLTTATEIQSNVIGLGLGGATGQGNLLHGVFLDGVDANTVGGTSSGAGNTISNNGVHGVYILAGSDNLVEGNRIGASPDGMTARPNGQNGVVIEGGGGNTIGGTIAGARNVISGNSANGIAIVAPMGNGEQPGDGSIGPGDLVQGNLIGLDLTGSNPLGNGLAGIVVTDMPGNTIGGTTASAGNVIAASGLSGIMLQGSGSHDNIIQGNKLGTDMSGDHALGNAQAGILISGAASNRIGGGASFLGNLISANGSHGVQIVGTGAERNIVAGNVIGLNAGGNRILGNAQTGVFLGAGALNNTLGGTIAAAGNVISGNASHGVQIVQGASNNWLQANRIGTDASGSNAFGNSGSGVLINNSAGNRVGVGFGNVISGNASSGVVIAGALATDNWLQYNKIGLNASGLNPLGNTSSGVMIDTAPGNLVGGSAGQGNVISGNRTFGVVIINAGATGNRLEGNLIGTNAAGSSGVGNALDGVLVNAAPGNTIGGPVALARNVISGNGGNGINAVNLGSGGGLHIQGNLIGVDPTGSRGLGNALNGVLLDGVVGAVIEGGQLPNVISGNRNNGLELTDGSRNARVEDAFIGTEVLGRRAVPNGLDGILLSGSTANTIGGTAAGRGNVVSGNLGSGIHLTGSGSTLNVLQNNRVGTDASGLAVIGNGEDGIGLDDAGINEIGGTAPGAGNVVSGNAGNGIRITGPSAHSNYVQGDTLGTDARGLVALPNAAFGLSIEGAANNFVLGDLISGNGAGGVQLSGFGASGNVIAASRIGTDRSGGTSLSNNVGIFVNGAGGNAIGGQNPGLGNIISGNATAGVYIFGRFAAGNAIQGNIIGLDATGQRPVVIPGAAPRQVVGVLINQSPGLDLADNPALGNLVGGTDPGARNVISGNQVGIEINGNDGRGNAVMGNLIGTTINGQGGVGNVFGVYLNGAPANTVGGSAPNVISGNAQVGVYLLGGTATGNRIVGNRIGVEADGATPLPNQNGVYIENAPANTIGGTGASDPNVISANTVAGVYILGGVSVNNLVTGNSIGATAAGATLGNGQYGVLLYNAPQNTVIRQGAGANTITGSGIANFREFTGAPVAANNPNPTGGTTTSGGTNARAARLRALRQARAEQLAARHGGRLQTNQATPAGPRFRVSRFRRG